MTGLPRAFPKGWLSLTLFTCAFFGCSASRPPTPQITAPTVAPKPVAPPVIKPPSGPAVMLGIDVLESEGFAAVKGKRLGLLTHPAGVNRLGVSTVDILRRAPGVQLVALYAVEQGFYNDKLAGKYFPDTIDARTGLMVHSLYSGKGKNFVPTPAQLQPIDALVIDLQDIGTRSYTFSGAMKTAMEACFQQGKEVIILDRPNPLGGLKVDGPPMDPQWMSDVGRFRVPYVHGLTMGELARLAKDTLPPGGLNLTEAQRSKARLTIVPMKGWRRSMRWPETGLTWVPTSPLIPDFNAVQGCPMTGLGCMLGGFRHGVGKSYPFRGISHLTVKLDIVEKEIRALHMGGLLFQKVSVPSARTGEAAVGLFINITDYDDWHPTELSLELMRLACKLEPKNPFAAASAPDRRTFLVHMGCTALFDDLVARGAKVDIAAWERDFEAKAKVYQQQSRKYWLYE